MPCKMWVIRAIKYRENYDVGCCCFFRKDLSFFRKQDNTPAIFYLQKIKVNMQFLCFLRTALVEETFIQPVCKISIQVQTCSHPLTFGPMCFNRTLHFYRYSIYMGI